MKNWMKRIGMMVFGVVMTFGVSIPAFADDAHFTFTNGEGGQYEQPATSTPGSTSSGGGIRHGLTSLVNGVKTGDHSVLLWVVLVIAAALVIGILVYSRKNLRIKRGKTLLSLILVAALAAGGLTTSFAFASDNTEAQTTSGVVEEDAVSGTDGTEAGTQDVIGVVEEDTSGGTDGSEDDPQEMMEDLAADPEDMDGEDVESGIQTLASYSTTSNYDDYAPYVQVCVDVEGIDSVGKALVEYIADACLLDETGYQYLYYAVDVTVGVYDASGNCVTSEPGAIDKDADNPEGYQYYLLYTPSGGSSQQIYNYNGGEMSMQDVMSGVGLSTMTYRQVVRGNTSFYIGGLSNGETVKAEESSSMERALLNVRYDPYFPDTNYVDKIGASTILSEGIEMSGSATGGSSSSEDNVIHLVNHVSALKESEIYVLMTDTSTAITTGDAITFVVERYDAASGTWSPASGISYLLFDGCTGVERDADGTLVSHDTENATQISDSEQTTGADGTITVTKTGNGYPFIRFPEDEVYANVWEGMEDGTLRIVPSSDGTNAAWGWLVGYDGEEKTGGPALSLSSSDTFYFGNDDDLAFDVEKEMRNGEEYDGEFTFYLRNLTSARTLPITSTSQILAYEAGAGISYIVYDVETKEEVGSGVTDDNGAFTLKAGQYAKFSVPEDTTWQVYEGTSEDYSLYSVEANDNEEEPGEWGYADNASIVDKVNGVVQDMAQNTQAVPATATLILTLTDFEDGTSIPGGTFALYRVVEDGEDVLIQKDLVTDENGQIMIEDCEPGTYYFKETTPPDGGYVIQDEGTSESVTVPEGLTEATEYTVSMKNNISFYAVKLWGICTDTYSYDEGQTTATASLTFGPALGDNASGDSTGYLTTYVSCDSDTCIHNLSWDEIIAYCNEYQGNETMLTSLFGSCLKNGCTKSVNLTPNEKLFNQTTVDNYRKYNQNGTYTGDGVSTLDYVLNGVGADSTHASSTSGACWNTYDYGNFDNTKNDDTLRQADPSNVYSRSRIRTTLTGDRSNIDEWLEEYPSANDYYNYATLCDESNCLLSCFPENLQAAMVPRTTVNSSDTADYEYYRINDKTTYDKLFLFSLTEMGLTYECDDSGGIDYGVCSSNSDRYAYEFGNVNAGLAGSGQWSHPTYWTRSRGSGNSTCDVFSISSPGSYQTSSQSYMANALSPGFCLK